MKGGADQSTGQGSVTQLPLGNDVVLVGMPPIGPDTSLGALGKACLCAASIEATGTDGEPVPLTVGLSGPLGLLHVAG